MSRIKINYKPCKGEINQVIYFALTGLVRWWRCIPWVSPTAIEFRPFRAFTSIIMSNSRYLYFQIVKARLCQIIFLQVHLRKSFEGALPLFSPVIPIIAPTTRETLTPPILPVDEILLGDPALNIKRDEQIPTGLPDGVQGAPSDGPGNNGGIGTGDKGGVGPGKGPGSGPGNNGGIGDDDYVPGGGRPGHEAATVVDTKPVPLNEPRPNYTEAARQHKITGMVRARVLIGSDGLIKQVRIIRGLPDGLNEEAISAAMQMRFKPAIKNGLAVSYWTSLDVEFNLR